MFMSELCHKHIICLSVSCLIIKPKHILNFGIFVFFFFFFFDEKYINISFIWKRDTTEKVDNNWEKNNKQLHTPLLNEPESLAINLCLHIKILGFLFLGSSNPI